MIKPGEYDMYISPYGIEYVFPTPTIFKEKTVIMNETKTKTYDLKLSAVDVENLKKAVGSTSWRAGLTDVYDQICALSTQAAIDTTKRSTLAIKIANLKNEISVRSSDLAAAEKQLKDLG